jgi:hypothetical protein
MKRVARITFLFATALGLGSAASAQDYNLCSNTISSNFNGTALAGGTTLWFSSVLNVKGLPSNSPVTVFVTHASISFTANGVTYHLKVPNSSITFSPSTTLATTDFTSLSSPFLGSGWDTQLQSSGLARNDLSQGVSVQVPSSGLPGGIKNVTWQATFSSFTSGLTVNWQWAAADYTEFSTDYNALGVKPVDDNQGSAYKNSDHAGTPEYFKSFVTGGATGGGGSNYTGSYSGTGSCALTPS